MTLRSANSLQSTRAMLKRAPCLQRSIRYASSSTQQTQIPPESPKYITIPRPPQIQTIPIRNMKGILPVPRTVHRKNQQKATPEYLSNVTSEPTVVKNISRVPMQEARDYIGWKSRQSAARRRNLREGLVQLKERQVRTDRGLAAIKARKRAEYEQRINAPEREDEHLTTPSASATIKALGLPHVSSRGDIEARRKRYEASEALKREKRRDVLHNLYVNAKDFIVSMDDLDAKIEEEFNKEFYKVNPEHGIWDEQGIPDTTSWLLSSSLKNPGTAADQGKSYTEVGERVQRVGRELTGGKL